MFLKYSSNVYIHNIKTLYLNDIYRTPVLTPEGADRWYVPTHEKRFFDFELVLPSGVTCEQCIMQVRNNNADKLFNYALIFLFSYNCNYSLEIIIYLFMDFSGRM